MIAAGDQSPRRPRSPGRAPTLPPPSPQDLETLDVSTLTPLSPEVISRQATINIGAPAAAGRRRARRVERAGLATSNLRHPSASLTPLTPTHAPPGTIGHVAHGKSTVVKAISGVQTVRFKNELERNITIKLGYANAKIYRCADAACPRPASYRAYPSSKEDRPRCDVPGFEAAEMELLRHVSFVDCPGHDILMATMLNGAAVMDGALLLIAANETCPQPQTSEHLAAVEIMRLEHIIILQNKVDLVTEAAALNQHEAIARFIQVRRCGLWSVMLGLTMRKTAIQRRPARAWLHSSILCARVAPFVNPKRDTRF